MRRTPKPLRNAAWAIALCCLASATARAEDEPAAKEPAKTAPARPFTRTEMGLWTEAQAAVLQAWLSDAQAEVEGVPLVAWLDRLASREGTEVAAARRVLLGLGRDAYPWVALGLGSQSRRTLEAPCADLAATLASAAGDDLAAGAMSPSVATRRVTLAAARKTGLAEEVRREALGDDDATVRRQAAVGLLFADGLKPETLAALEAALGDDDAGARAAAALALLRAGGPAAQRFATSLERPETRTRYPAASLLGLPPEAGDAALPLLASSSWRVRSHAATLLAVAEALSPRAVEALTARLDDASGDVRWRAARALDRPEARGAEAALRARLADAVLEVRLAAALALATLGSTDEAAVPVLVSHLQALPAGGGSGAAADFADLYRQVYGERWYLVTGRSVPVGRVTTALARHGAAGVAALRAAAKTADARRNAVAVYDAAGKAGDEALVASLTDADEGVRRAAALALARRGDARAQVVETLARKVGWDPWVDGHNERLDALLSLGERALPALRELLAQADDELRPGLGAALLELGPRAAPAIREVLRLPDVGESIPSRTLGVDTHVGGSLFERAILSIGAAGLDGLIAAIGSDDPATRERAFRACRLLGPLAKPALPTLHAALAAKRIPGWEDVSADDPIDPIE